MKQCTVIVVLALFWSAPLPVLADGISDYNARCAGCHGAHGNVQTEKARALQMDVHKLALKISTKDRSEVVAIIRSGKGKMPAFEKELSSEQIAAIADYVIALRKK